MPGFLEVYGYYDEDLGDWNIEVRRFPRTNLKAHD